MSTVDIRIRAKTSREAEQAKQQLEQRHGSRIQLGAPRAGRDKGVWFVYGSLQLTLDSPAELIERFLPTGDIPISRLEDIPSDDLVIAALEAIQLIRPDVAALARHRLEGLDAVLDQEGLDRLALAIVKLAKHLQGPKQ